MNLTEEEARQYYKAHPNEFMTPATVTLREICRHRRRRSAVERPAVFSVAADDDGARTKIDAARERALKGEDFAELVAEVVGLRLPRRTAA